MTLTFADIEQRIRDDVATGDDRCSFNRFYMELTLAELDKQRQVASNALYHSDNACTEKNALRRELEQANLTIKSVATMLGWENVPPRGSLEGSILALKVRAEQTPKKTAKINYE